MDSDKQLNIFVTLSKEIMGYDDISSEIGIRLHGNKLDRAVTKLPPSMVVILSVEGRERPTPRFGLRALS